MRLSSHFHLDCLSPGCAQEDEEETSSEDEDEDMIIYDRQNRESESSLLSNSHSFMPSRFLGRPGSTSKSVKGRSSRLLGKGGI